MLAERGNVDHSTIYHRWVQRYAPEMEKTAALVLAPSDLARGMDETCVKVNGRWSVSVYRAVDSRGRARFISPPVVTTKLHTGFLGKILNNVKGWQIPIHPTPG